MGEWWRLARSPSVTRRALKLALVVGTLLGLINHPEAVCAPESVPGRGWLQIGLTYLVPYCVSTYSAVQALRQKT